MSCANQNNQGTTFRQTLVDRQPNYEKRVVTDKRSKTMRPSMQKKKHTVKWL